MIITYNNWQIGNKNFKPTIILNYRIAFTFINLLNIDLSKCLVLERTLGINKNKIQVKTVIIVPYCIW